MAPGTAGGEAAAAGQAGELVAAPTRDCTKQAPVAPGTAGGEAAAAGQAGELIAEPVAVPAHTGPQSAIQSGAARIKEWKELREACDTAVGAEKKVFAHHLAQLARGCTCD